jgi:uroporphyrinogen decarboxylase
MSGSRERVLDVLEGKIPDRVPYFELLISDKVIERMHPGSGYLDFCEEERIDMVFAKWKFRNRWLDESKGIYTNEWKMIRKAGDEQTDAYLDGPIHSMEDLRSFVPPDPNDARGYENLRTALQRFGKSKIVCFFSKATFNHPWYMMGGMERYLTSMYLEPGLVLALNDMTTEFHLAQVQAAVDMGADVIALADDYAFRQQAFIPREKFVKFCLPAIRRISDLVHKNGRHLLFHSDGNLTELLDPIADSGVDFLHPVEPGAMDIVEVHKKFRDRFVICGNVDCARTLTFGEPGDAAKEVLRLLEHVAPGGRYIMTSSNTIHSQVRADTYRAMLDTLAEFGSYPIRV